MATIKGIKLISSPETQTEWPIPPDYAPLWTVSQIEEAIEGIIIHYGHEAIPTLNQADLIGLILRLKKDYDLALSKARLDVWACEGMKGGIDGTEVWYESKTIVINALVIAVVIAEFLLDQQQLGLLPFTLDPAWITFSLGIVNIILRFVSDRPLTRPRRPVRL